jgi:hypothetical protein
MRHRAHPSSAALRDATAASFLELMMTGRRSIDTLLTMISMSWEWSIQCCNQKSIVSTSSTSTILAVLTALAGSAPYQSHQVVAAL